MENAVGGHGGEALRFGQIEKLQGLLMALPGEMPLNFDKSAIGSEKRKKNIDQFGSGGEGDETAQFISIQTGQGARPRTHVGSFCGAGGEKAAEVSIPFAAFHQKGHETRVTHGNLGPHHRPHSGFLRGLKKSRRAGKAVTIRKANDGMTHPGGLRHEFLGA